MNIPVLIISVFMEMERIMIDEDKLLNEVFNELNKMSGEDFIEILKKASLLIQEEKENNDSIN